MTLATDPRRRFGDRGEDLAADFFIQNGFRLIERNWNCRLGEIDLIVEKQGKVHFVEVKIRIER
jgi:putative endonuclease